MKIHFQRHLMNFWSFAADFQGSFLHVSVFLAENQLLRERFKVDLKEIGKEK